MECKQDEYAKSMILHSITRCVYLLEAEVRERKQEVPPSQPGPWGLQLIPTPPPLVGQTCALGPVFLADGGRGLLRGLGDMWGRQGAQDTCFSPPLLSLLAHSRPLLVLMMISGWWAPCWMTTTTVSKSKL